MALGLPHHIIYIYHPTVPMEATGSPSGLVLAASAAPQRGPLPLWAGRGYPAVIVGTGVIIGSSSFTSNNGALHGLTILNCVCIHIYRIDRYSIDIEWDLPSKMGSWWIYHDLLESDNSHCAIPSPEWIDPRPEWKCIPRISNGHGRTCLGKAIDFWHQNPAAAVGTSVVSWGESSASGE